MDLPNELVSEALADCEKYGMRNIVALRGDPPRGQEKKKTTEGGFNSAFLAREVHAQDTW